MTAIPKRSAPDPHTLRARADLASIQVVLGDIKGALDGLSHVHADCVRALGARHPLTLEVRGRIGGMAGPGDLMTTMGSEMVTVLQERSGEGFKELFDRMADEVSLEEARAWAEEQLVPAEAHFAECEQVLGPGHTDTIAARLHLVALHGMKQDSAGAVMHAREAVATATRHLGPGAPMLFMAQALLLIVSVMDDDVSADGVRALNAQIQSLTRRMQDDLPPPLPPPGGESRVTGLPDAP
ncbi:hypothetical protein [Streptomyces chromofuscus]|uniref:hypothetical protein n=1 Tax=Streptomyces chromofuscus TaxID=42881 RepID=UPI0019AE7F37|nr:hypothetical protein [Streptomyces chromofuscus]GGS85712.1 hypothetical protein GCM10010254_01810 [Streptomyces chromofuscus]